MSHAGKDPPSGGATEPGARPGGSILPTPFGLIRIWESEGQTFLAETSSDGSILGPAMALAEAGASARDAAAAVHRVETSFFLTVSWLSGGTVGEPADLLIKTWQLGRGIQGLSLTASNDNPVVVGAGACEAGIAGLPGDQLLLTWIEGATGHVYGQIRGALPEGTHGQSFVMGQTTVGQTAVEQATAARRLHVLEVAPLEYAVLWLAANRRDIAGVSLKRDLTQSDDGDGAWSAQAMTPMPLDAQAKSGLVITGNRGGDTFEVGYETAGADGAAATLRQIMALPHGQMPEAQAGAGYGLTAADDFGFVWAAQDLLQLAPSALLAPGAGASHPGPLVTRGDEPLLIDLAAHGAGQGVKVVAVDGTPLAEDGPTRISCGWLQARMDGHLTFTPDVDAAGHVRLHLAGVSDAGAAWSRHLDVHVEGMYGAAEVELRNPVKAIPAHAVIAHNAQMAEIGFRGEAPPHGSVSLSGVDADKFVVIGNGLFLRSGTRVEPGRKALDVAVNFKDGLAGAAIAASLTIAVLNEPGTLLSLALPARAHAADISAGQLVAEVGVLEQPLGGDRISLALLSNAGGRFALSGGNLVVASPQLFTPDPEATYEVVVRMAQSNGVAIDHKITLHHEDVLGRLPPPPEPAPAAPPEEKVAIAAPAPPVEEAAHPSITAEPVSAERAEAGADTVPDQPHDKGSTEALPPLRVEAPAVRGSSSQPDLGTGAGSGRAAEAEGLSKVIAQQQREASNGSEHASRDTRSSESWWNRDDNRGDRHEKDLVEALRNLSRGDGDRDERGGRHFSELQKAQAAVSGDTLYFKPGFGKETIEHVKLSGGDAHDVLDLSLYGTTFEALRAAGAFEQVGNDVVLTLNPADPVHSDQIVLKSIDLHQIDPGDFKFS